MKVVNAAGESEMNQDQWEAASASILSPSQVMSLSYSLTDLCCSVDLYLAFALARR